MCGINRFESSDSNPVVEEFSEITLMEVTEVLSQEDFVKQKEKQMEYPIKGAAIGIILIQASNKVVLTKRSEPRPGWALPGGRVELNETFRQGFIREVREELGVEVYCVELVAAERKIFVSQENNERLEMLLATFCGRIPSETELKSTIDAAKEGLSVGVFALDQLPNDMVESDRQKILDYCRIINEYE